jgi:hypothetical protein
MTRILVLSSVSPNFAHFRASQTVLAHLLEELARLDLEVCCAVAGLQPGADATSQTQLRRNGVTILSSPCPGLVTSNRSSSRIARAMDVARQVIDPHGGRDDPEFSTPETEAERLAASGASAAILF